MQLAIRPAVEPFSIDKRFQQERAMTDLCDLTASELRRMIGRKDISPIELVESCIDRIESVDGSFNGTAITTGFQLASRSRLSIALAFRSPVADPVADLSTIASAYG